MVAKGIARLLRVVEAENASRALLPRIRIPPDNGNATIFDTAARCSLRVVLQDLQYGCSPGVMSPADELVPLSLAALLVQW